MFDFVLAWACLTLCRGLLCAVQLLEVSCLASCFFGFSRVFSSATASQAVPRRFRRKAFQRSKQTKARCIAIGDVLEISRLVHSRAKLVRHT